MTESVTRVRKSRFDSVPEPTYVPFIPDTAAALSTSLPPSTHEATAEVSYSLGSYEVVYQQKLNSALVKNFEYCLNKDLNLSSIPNTSFSEKQRQLVSSSYSQRNQERQVAQDSVVRPSAVGSSTSSSSQPSSSSTENCCIYISGFPLDFEEEDLNVLFSPQGKIKKVKLYRTQQGTCKGDALVTFTNHEAVLTSCRKLHNLNLGDGYLLKVSQASFDKTKSEEVAPESSLVDAFLNSVLDGNMMNESTATIASLQQLPVECKPDSCFVVILKRILTSGSHEINTEECINFQDAIMLECCKFGKVRAFIVPSMEGWVGDVLVSFDDSLAATACSSFMEATHSITCQVIAPQILAEPQLVQVQNDNKGEALREDEGVVNEVDSSIAAGVDDFLNSLL